MIHIQGYDFTLLRKLYDVNTFNVLSVFHCLADPYLKELEIKTDNWILENRLCKLV